MANLNAHQKQVIKSSVVGIGAVVAIVFTYFYLTGGPPAPAKTSGTDALIASDPQIKATLDALNTLKSIAPKVSANAFATLPSDTLRDFHLNIVPEPLGRPNPFAPFGTGTSKK